MQNLTASKLLCVFVLYLGNIHFTIAGNLRRFWYMHLADLIDFHPTFILRVWGKHSEVLYIHNRPTSREDYGILLCHISSWSYGHFSALMWQAHTAVLPNAFCIVHGKHWRLREKWKHLTLKEHWFIAGALGAGNIYFLCTLLKTIARA